jgi:uncharacterized protein YfdQ (DUF2303 family)
MMTPEAIELLLATGRKQQLPIYPAGGDPFFIDHVGNVKDLSAFAPPTRIKRGVTLTDVQSFAMYVNTYKEAGTIIFASILDGAASFTCILDYHDKDKPQFCSHTATFKTVSTPEWVTWQNANRKRMGQVEFANWIEDNLHLFVSPKDTSAPSGAELLELVKGQVYDRLEQMDKEGEQDKVSQFLNDYANDLSAKLEEQLQKRVHLDVTLRQQVEAEINAIENYLEHLDRL